MKEKILKNKMAIFVGIVILLLVISLILRVISPPIIPIEQSPTFTQSNIYNQQTTFNNIAFSGKAIEVPPQMTVGQAVSSTSTEATFLKSLEIGFQLEKLTQPANIWRGPDYSLSKIPVINRYTMSQRVGNTPATSIVNSEKAQATALALLQQYAPSSKIELVQSHLTYLTNELDSEEASPDKATLLFLPYTYLIDGLPVFYQNQQEFPFEFMIDGNNTIIKFAFYPFFIQITPLQKQNTITIEQAIKNINAGQGSLVRAEIADPAASDISQITSADLKTVTLEYRADTQSGYVYPFFRFSGDAKNKTGGLVTVEIITPAIQTATKQ